MSKNQIAGRLRHVLVVEDSPLIALELELSLQDLGVAQVTVAPDVGIALRVLAAGGIDAALVDLVLEEEDSEAVVADLDARGIPFAIMSGFDLDHPLAARFADRPRLSKPHGREALRAVLEAFC